MILSARQLVDVTVKMPDKERLSITFTISMNTYRRNQSLLKIRLSKPYNRQCREKLYNLLAAMTYNMGSATSQVGQVLEPQKWCWFITTEVKKWFKTDCGPGLLSSDLVISDSSGNCPNLTVRFH